MPPTPSPQAAAVRAWAARQHIDLRPRGRLPLAVVEAWRAAQAEPDAVADHARQDSVIRAWAEARCMQLDEHAPVPEAVQRRFANEQKYLVGRT